jgi:hypothetical protein
VSVDCIVTPAAWLESRGEAYLPLALLAKTPLRRFDVVDESSAAVPVLTSWETIEIGHQMLRLLAVLVLTDSEYPELSDEVDRDLRRIVESSSDEDATRSLREAAARAPATPADAGAAHQRALLWDNLRFQNLAVDLSVSFPLIVVLRPSGPGERRVLRFRYEQDAPPLNPTIAMRLGLRPLTLVTLAPSIGDCRSYHLEIEAPSGVAIQRASLLVQDRNRQPITVAYDDSSPTRAHLFTTGQPRGIPAVGLLDIGAAPGGGLLFPSLVVGVLATLMFLAGLIAHLLGYFARVDVAAALVLGVPGFLAAYLTRPDGHDLARRLLFGVRALLSVVALASFMAAAALATTLPPWTRSATWGFCAGLTFVCTILLLVAFLTSRRVERRRGTPGAPRARLEAPASVGDP